MVFRNKIPSSLFETALSHTTLSNLICVKFSSFKHFPPGGTQPGDHLLKSVSEISEDWKVYFENIDAQM